MSKRKLTVSARQVARELDEVLRQQAGLDEDAYRAECARIGHRPGTKRLAERANTSQRSLGRVFHGKPERLSFWTADQLLRAADLPPTVVHEMVDDLRFEPWEIGLAEDCMHLPALSELRERVTGEDQPVGRMH